MSVNIIPVEDFELIYCGVLFHVENDTELGSALIRAVIEHGHGGAYVADLREAAALNHKEISLAEAIMKTIGQMLWYVAIANRTAYAVQYGGSPDFEAGKLTVAAPMEVRTGVIAHLLRWIDYHAYTNAGTRFISDAWFGVFLAIKQVIDAHDSSGNRSSGGQFITQW